MINLRFRLKPTGKNKQKVAAYPWEKQKKRGLVVFNPNLEIGFWMGAYWTFFWGGVVFANVTAVSAFPFGGLVFFENFALR